MHRKIMGMDFQGSMSAIPTPASGPNDTMMPGRVQDLIQEIWRMELP